jgi:hypothetical protein
MRNQIVLIISKPEYPNLYGGRHDRMVVEFRTTYVIGAYHH